MTKKQLPADQIPAKMLSQDPFSSWLGIKILEVKTDRCKVGMTVRSEMMNSMGKAHGGIAYSLADSAFGLAANMHGKYAVSLETSINHIEAVSVGDVLTAEAVLNIPKKKVGFTIVEVKRGTQVVAIFKGVAYRIEKEWES